MRLNLPLRATLPLLLLSLAACSGRSKQGLEVGALCGDGVLQEGEACDDGNAVGGDGCSADCFSDERCGNGVVDADAGEVCDDGNTSGGDGCSADCRRAGSCGDGVLDAGEECDDGEIGSAECDADCTFARCGDGTWNEAAGEQCDDGGPSATCNEDCTLARCGDGIVNALAGEACDAAGESFDCDVDCTPALCGDGVWNASAGEGCDDGNLVETDACLPTCVPNVCGDGILNPEAEACDDGNTITETECPYGMPTCLACDATCEEILELAGPFCGDGIVSGPEACDARSGGLCGACSADCEELLLSRARGSIAAVGGAEIDDGDTITIDDGARSVTLEFDTDGVVAPGNVRIPFTSSSSPATIARQIGNAIDAASVGVVANVAGSVVLLEQTQPGRPGNRPITVDGPFVVTGFTGGLGYDCPAGSACTQDADCESRLICGEDGTCQAP